MRSNFTATTKRLRAQFNTTLKQLHDRVVMTKQYRTLLDKRLDQTVLLENSLATLKDGAYNVTQQLRQVKGQLIEAIKVIKTQRDDISKIVNELNSTRSDVVRLRKRLREVGIDPSTVVNDPTSSSSSSSSSFTSRLVNFVSGGSKQASDTSGGLASSAVRTGSGATGSSGDWVEYKDAKDRKYYYNKITKKTQWQKPEGFVSNS